MCEFYFCIHMLRWALWFLCLQSTVLIITIVPLSLPLSAGEDSTVVYHTTYKERDEVNIYIT